jgi:hypothetical protein
VAARAAGHADPNSFDLARLTYPVLILHDTEGIERLLIGDAAHHLRLDVLDGSVLDGPVRFRYRLADGGGLPAKITTLRRLVALQQLGRFPRQLFWPEPSARRWMRALQAFDGRAIGASHREIAAALYGADIMGADWLGPSSYLRCRVQRALRFGCALVQGGYRRLLQ